LGERDTQKNRKEREKMKKKKVTSLLLALSMTAALLSGCGSGSDDSGAGTQTTQPAEEQQASDEQATQPTEAEQAAEPEASGDEEEVTIRLATWDYEQTAATQEIVAAFEKEYPNIHVEVLDYLAADYVGKLTTMLNAESDVDVLYVKEADGLKAFVDKGQFAALDDFIAADSVDLSAYNGLADYYNFDGSCYALPARSDFYVMFYNKDLFDKAGVPYPSNDWTWEEFEETAAKVTNKDEDITGAFFHSWNACVQNWGVQDGKHTIMDYETGYDFFKPYYEMVLRMEENGSAVKYADIKAGNLHYSSAFAQGNIAMMPMGTWQIATIAKQIADGESKVVNWGVATLPHAADVAAGYTVGSTTPVAMTSFTEHPDAAWKLLKFITGEEGAAAYVATGSVPGRVDDSVISAIAALDGMPEGLAEALVVKNISLDRPCADKVVDVNQALNEVHSEILLGELSVDDGLAKMAERVAEIME